MAENSLRRLRREAGFSSAKAFAEYVGIPVPTYTRYEQGEDGPETSIPIKNACLIADALGCTVDAVIGRSEVPDSSVRNDMQLFYNRLSEEGKARMEEFCDYLEYCEKRAGDRVSQWREAEYIRMAVNFEQALVRQETDEDGNNALLFLSAKDRRDRFENFVGGQGVAMFIVDERQERLRIERDAREVCGLVYYDDDGTPILEVADDPVLEESIQEEIESDLDRWRERRRAEDKEVIANVMQAYDKLHPDIAGGCKSQVTYHFVTFE